MLVHFINGHGELYAEELQEGRSVLSICTPVNDWKRGEHTMAREDLTIFTFRIEDRHTKYGYREIHVASSSYREALFISKQLDPRFGIIAETILPSREDFSASDLQEHIEHRLKKELAGTLITQLEKQKLIKYTEIENPHNFTTLYRAEI